MTTAAITPIRKLLIANRGEISSRIIRTCRQMGIFSIAVHSEADKNLPFVKEADIAVNIGGFSPAESYLDQDKIIQCALNLQADAIHPGFGFLSENYQFVDKVEAAGLVFVGPSSKSIFSMGDKSESKRLLKDNPLVPLIPGYEGHDQSLPTLMDEARKIGFPILVKASAGGGGKGMRIVTNEAQLENAIIRAKSEALSAFGNSNVLIEKYFEKAKHIEVQIFGDKHGRIIHCFERECSMQRRFQKVIEEAPSPSLDEELRVQICQAAVAVAKTIGYYNAGTVEFIYDSATREFFFLEVNTRLQVEHPVTEEILGIDLVRWQLEVAQGFPLPVSQEDLRPNGHAIEVRLYAENASEGFLPSTGTVTAFSLPSLEGIRYEMGVVEGSTVDIYYDPMMAKIVAKGANRVEATARLSAVLGQMDCLGFVNNRHFLRQLLISKSWTSNDFDTKWIDRNISSLELSPTEEDKRLAAIALTCYRFSERNSIKTPLSHLRAGWRNLRYAPSKEHFIVAGGESEIAYSFLGNNAFDIEMAGHTYHVNLEKEILGHKIKIAVNGVSRTFSVGKSPKGYFIKHDESPDIFIEVKDRFPSVEEQFNPGDYVTPMPGEVKKVFVKAGDSIEEGMPLLVMVSMKMENTIYAHSAGIIEEIFVEEGTFIEAGRLMFSIKT